jgi:hypothetical protein
MKKISEAEILFVGNSTLFFPKIKAILEKMGVKKIKTRARLGNNFKDSIFLPDLVIIVNNVESAINKTIEKIPDEVRILVVSKIGSINRANVTRALPSISDETLSSSLTIILKNLKFR